MSIRKFRALMALGLYAVAVVTAVTADSLTRSAELSGLSYNGTFDTVAVIVSVVLGSALFGWNAGEYVAYGNRVPLDEYEYYRYAEYAGDYEANRRYAIRK